jgi:hypothetical protein
MSQDSTCLPSSKPLVCMSFSTRTSHGRNLGGGQKGANAPPIFFLPKNSFLATELKRGEKFGVRVAERDVCILRTGSNQSSPPFLT